MKGGSCGIDSINKRGKNRIKNRLPYWFKQDLPGDDTSRMGNLLYEFSLNTVCREAKCPNLTSCFADKQATFLILGSLCTRSCRFCAVGKSKDEDLFLDLDEPYRISSLLGKLGLDYVVITSVARDDLYDGGSEIFGRTVDLIHKLRRNIKVEVLIPDFQGREESLKAVLESSPEVLAHNIETVSRLYRYLRPQADYRLSLALLKKAKELNPGVYTKSSMMLGLGETETEVVETMRDLRANKCDILTLGQYLAPSLKHYPVKEFININDFQKYSGIGIDMGFKGVLSGPLVRSSYRAGDLYRSLADV